MTLPHPPHVFPPAAPPPGARWPVLAASAGLLASATALLPFGAGLLAVVFAGVGIAAGIAGFRRAGPGRGRQLALTGVAASSPAIVAAMVMAVIYQPHRATRAGQPSDSVWLHATDNADAILRDQLQVGFGVVGTGGKTLLPVTLTNRMDRGAMFHLVVAGFVGDKEIARDTVFVVLAGHATQRSGLFHRYQIGESGIPRLRKARFRVVEAAASW